MEGSIGDDSDFLRLRVQYENLIIHGMREEGYVPVLGLGPYFSTRWLEDGKVYQFKISIYGVKVGRKQSWNLEGIDVEGHYHRRHIQQPKSSQS